MVLNPFKSELLVHWRHRGHSFSSALKLPLTHSSIKGTIFFNLMSSQKTYDFVRARSTRGALHPDRRVPTGTEFEQKLAQSSSPSEWSDQERSWYSPLCSYKITLSNTGRPAKKTSHPPPWIHTSTGKFAAGPFSSAFIGV